MMKSGPEAPGTGQTHGQWKWGKGGEWESAGEGGVSFAWRLLPCSPAVFIRVCPSSSRTSAPEDPRAGGRTVSYLPTNGTVSSHAWLQRDAVGMFPK